MPAVDNILEKIHYLAQFTQRPVSLKKLFEFGLEPSPQSLLIAAQFLHQELPVRLSHRVQELESLPCGLSEMPAVCHVKGMYIDSVRELIAFQRPETQELELAFTQTLDRIKRRHKSVVSNLAQGIIELKETLGAGEVDPRIQDFLDRFYMSRIGIRMLIGQHIALHAPIRPGYAGLISERCAVSTVLRQAAEKARILCVSRYGIAPEVGIFGNADLAFTYIPSHLEHMLFELLKNSMRAVVEFRGSSAENLPIIRVVIAKGEEDLTIKVSDEGGGIPRSGIHRIWTYFYTTATPPLSERNTTYSSDFSAPLAGLGYGLPVSRLYARYFGGDLQVLSMEGYGTDAYLHLKQLATASETLPRKLL